MRLTNHFTLHALAAAALAAFAATGAAAADAFLKLGDIKGESADRILNPVPRDGGKQIEITSWSWGATRKGWDGTIKGSKIKDRPLASGVRVAAGDVDADGRADIVSPRDAASGMPTGKRQHGPVTISKPYEAGSMTFRGVVTGCAGGTTYRDATMVTRNYKYEFQDVVITSCATAGGGGGGGGVLSMEEVSFNYGKIVTTATSASDRMQWDLAKAKKL